VVNVLYRHHHHDELSSLNVIIVIDTRERETEKERETYINQYSYIGSYACTSTYNIGPLYTYHENGVIEQRIHTIMRIQTSLKYPIQ
jgi:hypothetical protein